MKSFKQMCKEYLPNAKYAEATQNPDGTLNCPYCRTSGVLLVDHNSRTCNMCRPSPSMQNMPIEIIEYDLSNPPINRIYRNDTPPTPPNKDSAALSPFLQAFCNARRDRANDKIAYFKAGAMAMLTFLESQGDLREEEVAWIKDRFFGKS